MLFELANIGYLRAEGPERSLSLSHAIPSRLCEPAGYPNGIRGLFLSLVNDEDAYTTFSILLEGLSVDYSPSDSIAQQVDEVLEELHPNPFDLLCASLGIEDTQSTSDLETPTTSTNNLVQLEHRSAITAASADGLKVLLYATRDQSKGVIYNIIHRRAFCDDFLALVRATNASHFLGALLDSGSEHNVIGPAQALTYMGMHSGRIMPNHTGYSYHFGNWLQKSYGKLSITITSRLKLPWSFQTYNFCSVCAFLIPIA